MEDTTIANERMNKQCGTEGIDYLSPETGLSSLFRWAVPKVVEELRLRPNVRHIQDAYAKLFNVWLERLFATDYKDPADALFWVLDCVLEAKDAKE